MNVKKILSVALLAGSVAVSSTAFAEQVVSSNSSTLYQEALQAYKYGDYDAVISSLNWMSDSATLEELQLAGAALGQAKQYTSAQKVFEKITKLSPSDPRAWYNLGVTYEKLNKLENAISAYQSGVLIDDTSTSVAPSYLALGKIYQRLDKPKSASLFFLKVTQLTPENIDAHFLLGTSAVDAKDWKRANLEVRELQQLRSPLSVDLQNYIINHHPSVF